MDNYCHWTIQNLFWTTLSKDMITSFFKSDNKDFENFTSKMYILYILLDSSSVNVDREK